jgi:hypothetical protein
LLHGFHCFFPWFSAFFPCFSLILYTWCSRCIFGTTCMHLVNI